MDICQNGDDRGYTELYNRHAKGVYNSIYRIVSHTAEAEDILQEVFVVVFSDIGRLNGVESFEAWVKRIAINHSISHLRKKKILFSDAEHMEIADEREQDLEEHKLFECRVEEVQKAIQELPHGYRTIVSLYLLENMPQEEIGKVLGISHNTVRTQYHRAKKKIMLSLKDKSYHAK